MITAIGEPVKVGAVFDPEQTLQPKWFVWNHRKYSVDRVTFSWKVRDGQRVFHHFAVTDGANLYELTYESATLSWRLMAVSPM
ncbi:MAG TPA: hypothetical protein VFH55_05625 [Nitrospiria bacterium]|nr:hypothetical protein [Nitrospiria bacterium]